MSIHESQDPSARWDALSVRGLGIANRRPAVHRDGTCAASYSYSTGGDFGVRASIKCFFLWIFGLAQLNNRKHVEYFFGWPNPKLVGFCATRARPHQRQMKRSQQKIVGNTYNRRIWRNGKKSFNLLLLSLG
ncbi:hypothetical protein V8C40DRAFT_253783 [Trichoderma camerunense]